MKKIIIALVLVGVLFSFVPLAKADTIQPSQDQLKVQLIQLLTQMIAQLQAQINAILAMQSSSIPMPVSSPVVSPIVDNSQSIAPPVVKDSTISPTCTLSLSNSKVNWTSTNAFSGHLYFSLNSENISELNCANGTFNCYNPLPVIMDKYGDKFINHAEDFLLGNTLSKGSYGVGNGVNNHSDWYAEFTNNLGTGTCCVRADNTSCN